MSIRLNRGVVATAAALAAGVILTGCGALDDQATTVDMCAYTQGSGVNGNDANVREIYYPGEVINTRASDIVYYFPCNERNLRFAPGTTDILADGTPIGPITVRNSDETEVILWVDMDWKLNQDEEVLRETTIPLLAKARAATTDPSVRNSNLATDGWSKGFLGENATPVLQTAIADNAHSYGAELWEDPSVKQELASAIAEDFMVNIKRKTGATGDVFCGSGASSGWSDPDNPGDGEYNCGTVRVTVSYAQPADESILNRQAEQAQAVSEAEAREKQAEVEKAANRAELEAARERYGDLAEEILGTLDTIEACAEAGMKICTSASGVNVGTTTVN